MLASYTVPPATQVIAQLSVFNGMDDVRDVQLRPLSQSQFLDPRCVHYNQNGIKKKWECILEHADVSILLFNTTRNVFVFVKQFRPAVYLQNAETEMVNGREIIDTRKYTAHLGVTIELCAGIVDKDEPLVLIAQAEVLEECGYDVPVERLQKITSFRNGTGPSGAIVNLYYAEVTDAMRVSKGGGLASEGELIEVVEMSVGEARSLVFSESINREASLMFAIQWFMQSIWPQHAQKM